MSGDGDFHVYPRVGRPGPLTESASPPPERRRLEVTIPEEPRVGSVVLDRDGVAVQRHPDLGGRSRWSDGGPLKIARSWPGLLVDRGPVTVVHDGDGTPPGDPS